MSYLFVCSCRLAGDQRARRDIRHDSDAEDDDDVKKVRMSFYCPISVCSTVHKSFFHPTVGKVEFLVL